MIDTSGVSFKRLGFLSFQKYNPNTFDTVIKAISPFLIRLRLLFPLRFLGNPVTPQPFFVFGSGRNGSTLLNRMLNTHPDLSLPTEQYFLSSMIYRFVLYNYLDASTLTEKMMQLLKKRDLHTWQDTDWNELDVSSFSFSSFIDQVFRLQCKTSQHSIWGDTTPVNTFQLPLIYRFFDSARYIFLLRDGRDVVASYQQNANAFDHLPTFESQIDFWLLSIQYYEWLKKRSQVLLVKYEDLINDTDSTLRAVCDFLEVGPSMNWQKFNENTKDTFFQKEQHRKVRGNLDKTRTGTWKQRLTREQMAFCEKKMQPYLRQFGYELGTKNSK